MVPGYKIVDHDNKICPQDGFKLECISMYKRVPLILFLLQFSPVKELKALVAEKSCRTGKLLKYVAIDQQKTKFFC